MFEIYFMCNVRSGDGERLQASGGNQSCTPVMQPKAVLCPLHIRDTVHTGRFLSTCSVSHSATCGRHCIGMAFSALCAGLAAVKRAETAVLMRLRCALELQDIYDRLDELDPSTFETDAAKLLHGLGFDRKMMAKATKDMSGEFAPHASCVPSWRQRQHSRLTG